MQDFRQLKVWAKAHELTVAIYKVSSEFPKSETFGLTAQIRSSASSIPTNIAEGCGRGSDAEFARFLQIGMGSASETEYHLLLAHDLGYLDQNKYILLTAQVTEIKRMLTTLIIKVKERIGSNKYRISESVETSIDDLNHLIDDFLP
jgi:four helix bundle protein